MKIGILGGGQLGKLFIDNIVREQHECEVFVYSPYKPLSDSCTWYQGDLNDKNNIINFAGKYEIDMVTIEIEDVNCDGLRYINDVYNVKVYPSPDIVCLIQDKLLQKQWLKLNNFPIAKLLFTHKEAKSDTFFFKDKPHHLDQIWVNKLNTGGYDGRGVQIINPMENRLTCFHDLFTDSFVEEKVDIEKELSVIVGRNISGETCVMPISEMIFNDGNMLDYLICPARISSDIWDKCEELAHEVAKKLELVGILAIELFYDTDGKIWINEISPRPHNSGHHMDVICNINQHELLYLCLINNPLPSNIELKIQNIGNYAPNFMKNQEGFKYQNRLPVVLLNIIGKEEMENPYVVGGEEVELLEWYGKIHCRPGRKMGHIVTHVPIGTIEIKDYVERIRNCIRIHCHYDVAVIMGSSSDLNIISPAIDILKEFNIKYKVKVVSAHRTPFKMIEYGRNAEKNGYKVIIAAAGGAAHLPGMIASATDLPVIGIPVKSTNSIDGWDSVLSILQMPGGIPVGTMALNGAQNAALYAIRILALNNKRLRERLREYRQFLENKVEKQNQDLVI